MGKELEKEYLTSVQEVFPKWDSGGMGSHWWVGLRNGFSSNEMNYLMFTMQLRMDLALKIVA